MSWCRPHDRIPGSGAKVQRGTAAEARNGADGAAIPGCGGSSGARARGSCGRAASGASVDEVAVGGGRQPQADAGAVEGGPPVAAAVPAEDGPVQVPLDMPAAQAVVHALLACGVRPVGLRSAAVAAGHRRPVDLREPPRAGLRPGSTMARRSLWSSVQALLWQPMPGRAWSCGAEMPLECVAMRCAAGHRGRCARTSVKASLPPPTRDGTAGGGPRGRV